MTTITIDRAVVERALELLGTWAKPPARLYRVMDNLRAALAQQDEPVEQVAWRLWDEDPQGGGDWRYYDAKDFKEGIDPMKYFDGLVPLYLAPPQRKPQTLDEAMRLPRAMAQAYENGYKAGVAAEREACAKACEHQSHWVACAAAIRARGNT